MPHAGMAVLRNESSVKSLLKSICQHPHTINLRVCKQDQALGRIIQGTDSALAEMVVEMVAWPLQPLFPPSEPSCTAQEDTGGTWKKKKNTTFFRLPCS